MAEKMHQWENHSKCQRELTWNTRCNERDNPLRGHGHGEFPGNVRKKGPDQETDEERMWLHVEECKEQLIDRFHCRAIKK